MKILKSILKVFSLFILLLTVLAIALFVVDHYSTNYLNVANNDGSEVDSYLIRNINVVPMTQDTVLSHQMVLIENGIITEIASSIDQKDLTVVDGHEKYLVPGLIDMHVHVWDKYELGMYLSNGVTAVRNLWGQPMHLRMKDEIATQQILSPHFYTSGPKLTGSEFQGSDNLQIFSEREARDAIISIKENGYDFIKTYYGLPQLYFDVIIDQAKLSGLDIVSHPSKEVAYNYHFKPQIKSIEHAEDIVQQPLDYKLDTSKLKEVILQFKQSKSTSFCPTLTVYHNIYNMLINDSILESESMNYINPLIRMVDSKEQFKRWANSKAQDSSVVERIKQQHKFHLFAVQQLHEAGVNIVCGTDAGIGVTLPGISIHQELAFYSKSGLSNYEVLKTATINASKTHDFMSNLGTIEKGKIANLLVVDDNPLQNLNTLERPNAVFVNGRKIDRQLLDHFEKKASERKNLMVSVLRYIEFLAFK